MRLIFSLLGLLLVVAIVGVLTKSQLSAVTRLPTEAVMVTQPSQSGANNAYISDQSKQMQMKEQLDAAVQAAAATRNSLEALESK